MKEYLVEVQTGDDEQSRRYELIDAISEDDAEEKALALGTDIRNIAVFVRVR
jgi:hypothetical protein